MTYGCVKYCNKMYFLQFHQKHLNEDSLRNKRDNYLLHPKNIRCTVTLSFMPKMKYFHIKKNDKICNCNLFVLFLIKSLLSRSCLEWCILFSL